jgi:hypothetical protein
MHSLQKRIKHVGPTQHFIKCTLLGELTNLKSSSIYKLYFLSNLIENLKIRWQIFKRTAMFLKVENVAAHGSDLPPESYGVSEQ